MRLLGLIFSLAIFAGCIESSKTIGDYVSWVENPDNGLRVSKESGGFQIIAQYRPIDYIICSETKNKIFTQEEYLKRKQDLSGMEYFQVRLLASAGDPLMHGSGDKNEYHIRNNFLMFGQKDFISLLRGNDTIPCQLYHFVNYQGLTPYADILVGFKSDSLSNEDRELIYDDQIFGFGPLHYTFSSEEIKSVPELELN